MKEKFKKLWEKVKTLWSGFTKTIKIVIIVAAAVIIAGSVGLTIFLNHSGSSDWIVLFPGMSNEESTEVYLELQNKGVETKINSGGEIEVKKDQWDNLVYELAQLGYPQSTPSYGTFFDNLSMTMTEFEKKQTLRFELQDRLQTTLKRIDGIQGAIVTITFPESSDYAWKENNDKAKASVTLTLSNSAGFTAENVSAVKNLVAFSAQQLQPEDVTVINSSTGQELLSAEEVEATNTSSGIDVADKMEYSNTLKAQYEANARAILQNIYPDGVDAVATVEVDYDKVVEEMKQLLPDEDTKQGYMTDEHVEYDTDKNVVNKGGVVGEENNTDIPNYQNKEEDKLNSDDTPHYERDIQYDLGYLLRQTEKAQGTVKNASISVVVTTENAYMSRDERNAVIQLVKNATNIPEENISVYSRESNKLPVVVDDSNNGGSFFSTNTGKLVLILCGCGLILLLLVALAVFLILRNMKKKMKRQQEESEAAITSLQETIEENNKKSLEEAAEEHNKSEKATELEVREFAKNNPEITAALIRSMLKERE